MFTQQALEVATDILHEAEDEKAIELVEIITIFGPIVCSCVVFMTFDFGSYHY